MDGLGRWLLVLLGLLLLSNIGDWMGLRLAARHPRLSKAFLKLGADTSAFAMGLLGLVLVTVVLRALGWLPLSR